MNASIKKILSFFCPAGKRQNQRSQVAVIIALFIAVIVLLTIVYLNLTKISNIKMLTANAADKAALAAASRIGSISHEYKVKFVPTYSAVNNETCITDFNLLLMILLGALVAVMLIFVGSAFMISPVQAILTGIGLSVSLIMSAGIGRNFQEMTVRNGIREAVIYQILQTVVSDDVELKTTSLGTGIFREIDVNGSFTGPAYDLSSIPAMRRQRKVNRFQAWYYTKRLPLVDDSVIKQAATDFVENTTAGIKRYVYYDHAVDYNMAKLKLDNVALLTDTSGLGGNAYEVTCPSGCSGNDCPEWVRNAATNELIILRLDANNNVTGGLLWDNPAGKMRSLFNRLQSSYSSWFGLGPALIDPDDFSRLVNDLQYTLIRFKEVINMPVNQRVIGLQQWFSFFYQEDKHLCDPHTTPAVGDPDDPDSYNWDIYLRLERSRKLILEHWIPALEDLNNDNIINNVPDPGGSYCLQGRGDIVEYCYESYACCAWNEYGCTATKCISEVPATWEGTYGTCVGNGVDHSGHPVCQGGDFFEGIPAWCCNNLRIQPCITHSGGCSSCFPPPGNTIGPRTEHYYQGQMSWDNTNAPTEVKQAVQVLYGIASTMQKMQLSINNLYSVITHDIPSTVCPPPPNDPSIKKEYLRNNAVYAWLDKPQADGRPRFAHLVSVNVSNYPVFLPNITEKVNWWSLPPQRCVVLHNAEGEITFRVSRYDQDQPTAWWNLRRRKSPLGAEYPPEALNAIIADCADGLVDTTAAHIANIEAGYSINSSCRVNYGPDKEDVRILDTN